MVFGVIYVQFSTCLFSRKFWFSEISYFGGHFSTLHAAIEPEFSTPHPGPKAILGHCGWSSVKYVPNMYVVGELWCFLALLLIE